MSPTFGEEVPPVSTLEEFPLIPEPVKTLEVPNKWIPSPELRLWGYRVIVAVVPLLVLLGVFTDEVASNILNIAAAVLAVGGVGLAAANTPKLTSGDVPEVPVAEAAENVDHALVTGAVKPLD